MINRRSFLQGAASLTAGIAAMRTLGVKAAEAITVDPNLSVFFSDIHISGLHVKGQPTYQNPLLDKAIDQVLAMRPRPKRVLVFGDIALWHGLSADYAESAPKLKRLEAAGIEVFVTTGNHDHRDPLFKAYPKQRAITPVPNRVVSVVDLGSADFLLMDSLQENPKGEGSGNHVDGILDAEQGEWLLDMAKKAKRPFFVGAHHPAKELSIGNKMILTALDGNPMFAGYIHGHDHRWYNSWYHRTYDKRYITRWACLPSTGWWGTIGFTTFRTFADRAELVLAPNNDFFFPYPLQNGEKRPADWDNIVAEEKGARCTFTYCKAN